MKVAIVYNEYLNSESYRNNINKYLKGLLKAGLDAFTISASDILYRKKHGFNSCIFLDKDIHLARILEKEGVRVFNSSKTIDICDSKITTYEELMEKDINMPKTCISPFVFYGGQKEISDFPLSYPIIIKEEKGSWGEQVYLAKSKEEYLAIIKNLKSRYLIQEYLPEGNRDIRVITVGGKAIAAMERKNENDFRSNAEQGGVCSKTAPSQSVISLAEKVSEELNMDFGGIDIIVNQGIPYLIEANSNPFINHISEVTEVDIGYEIGLYLKNYNF